MFLPHFSLERLPRRFQQVKVQTHVWSDMVVPVLVLFCGWKCISVSFICVERPFYFAVWLWVFDTAEYLFYSVLVEEFFEFVVPSIVARELSSVIADAFLNGAVLQRFFHSRNALFRSWALTFPDREQRSARIVKYFEDPDTIIWSLMPVNMHSCQAVPSFVTNLVFLSNHLFFSLLRQTFMKQNSMNSVVRNASLVVP